MSEDRDARPPLAGVRVVEFTHMVMGPTCGMILGDLGADVIKVEPIQGDATRRLLGSGAGFFATFNRNKKSIAVDMKTPEGLEVVRRLIATADVFCENFRPGAMEALGFDAASLEALNPRLVVASLKGFLPGPYENRTALDEVVQMMGGLAYMTGPEGRPLRAGSSVNDIMGGLFAALGVVAALAARDRRDGGTGKGAKVTSALFENNVFLVAQHMMQYALTGRPAAPMPSRISAWGVYDVFTVKDGEQIFLAVVSDTQWRIFCEAFGFEDLLADPELAGNNARVKARERMMPILRERLSAYSAEKIGGIFEKNGLPFAPIARPEDLFLDPHLVATGGLAPMSVPADACALGARVETKAALLPLAFDDARLPVRLPPPSIGEHGRGVLADLGYSPERIAALERAGVVSFGA